MTVLNALGQIQAIVGTVDGRIIHWSQGAERLYGWTASEAIGRRVGDLLNEKEADGSEAGAPKAPRDEIWEGELIRRHKDGRELLISAQRVSRRDAGSQATAIELDSLIATPERAADPPAPPAKQTEGSGCPTHRIAHDIKNLLGVLALNLELARECAAGGGELRKMIDEALAAAWQGAELTSRLAGSAPHRPA
jgi:PAS domain S-box-containing protein